MHEKSDREIGKRIIELTNTAMHLDELDSDKYKQGVENIVNDIVYLANKWLERKQDK